MIRVFQIGLHIAGTRSLAAFFKSNNFESFHHENHYAEQLFKNLKDGKTYFDPPYHGPFKGKQGVFYSDMQSWKPARDGQHHNKLAGYTLFKEIDKGYPGSLFILNLRNGWVESKMKKPGFRKSYPNKTDDEMKEMLQKEMDDHHRNVREYFRDRKNFIEFHIHNDKIQKLATWLRGFNLEIKSESFPKIRG